MVCDDIAEYQFLVVDLLVFKLGVGNESRVIPNDLGIS